MRFQSYSTEPCYVNLIIPDAPTKSLTQNGLSYFRHLWYPLGANAGEERKMWTETTQPQYRRDGLRYASDVTDTEWALIESFVRAAKKLGRPRCARWSTRCSTG